jgi:hypothetical protein
LLLIVRTFFNDAVTVAIRTGFHVCLPVGALASLPAMPSYGCLTPNVILACSA